MTAAAYSPAAALAGLDALTQYATLGEGFARYMRWAEAAYRKIDRTPTREHLNMQAALARFVAYCPAGEATPLEKVTAALVRGWLDQLAAEQLTRGYCNACLARLRRFIRWCAENEIAPAELITKIAVVHPLAPYRSSAVEPPPKRPPPLDEIARILPYLPPVARDVLQLSKLTASRPGEILGLRNGEIHLDVAAGQPMRAIVTEPPDAAESTPDSRGGRGGRIIKIQHKTAHKRKSRIVPLSEEAVAILDKYRRPLSPDDYVFPTTRRAASKSGHYSLSAYARAISRACAKAGVTDFAPYDVRRAAARRARKECGLDAAQALLGHSNSKTTEVYAPLDPCETDTFRLAAGAAGKLGAAARSCS